MTIVTRYSGILVLSVVAATSIADRGWAQQRANAWRAIEVARIGSVDAPDQALTRVTHVKIGRNGEVFVAQPMDRTIRVYDDRGHFVRMVGREGEGPGEFRSIVSMGFLSDTLYVSDGSLRRVSFFSADGSFIRSINAASPLLGKPPAVLLPTVPTVLVPGDFALIAPGVPVAWIAAGGARVPYLKLNLDTQELDTLIWQELSADALLVMKDGLRFSAALPFSTKPQLAFAGDGTGIVLAEMPDRAGSQQARFTIRKVGLSGGIIFDQQFAYDPIRTSDGVIAEVVAECQARMSRRGDRPSLGAIEQALRQGGHIPPMLPPVTAVATGQDGSIWVKRERSATGSARWDVLDSAGGMRGNVILPSRQAVLAARGDVLIAVELDELDVPYVVYYRVQREEA